MDDIKQIDRNLCMFLSVVCDVGVFYVQQLKSSVILALT